MSAISISNVSKRFKNTVALRDISLQVEPGELTVLLGPSGCGKTTLLRIVAGLEEASGGSIRIGDDEVGAIPTARRDIAMVFQNYAIFPHMSVEKNIAFGLRMKKFAPEVVAERVAEAMNLMQIGELASRYPSQLSGGQRQRVAVARALAMKPAVLLMDEPLSNLDALLRLEMRVELKSLLKQTRTTTLYVTHDQVEAMSLADRIAVLYGGEVQQYTDVATIYSDPAREFVAGFIGNPPMNIVRLAGADSATLALVSALAPPHADYANLNLGIRAENIEAATTPLDNAWSARVLVVEPLGAHWHITVNIGGRRFRALMPAGAALGIGDTLYLRPDPSAICWFTPAGARIK